MERIIVEQWKITIEDELGFDLNNYNVIFIHYNMKLN